MPRRSGRDEEQIADLLLPVLNRMLSTREGRRTLLALVAIALIAAALYLIVVAAHRPHYAAGPTVRVATWNLRQFSPSRREVNLRRFAQVIQDNQFDVVAVQEVKRDGQEIDALLNVLGSPWHAALGPINDSHTHAGGNNERFAFLYNAARVR